MKYFAIGAGILAVLLAVCILSGLLVSERLKPAQAELSLALSALEQEQYDSACAYAERAAKKWRAEQHKLSALLSHETLEEVSVAFSDLSVYCERRNYSEFHARCKLLQMQLAHIAQMDSPYYYNLL